MKRLAYRRTDRRVATLRPHATDGLRGGRDPGRHRHKAFYRETTSAGGPRTRQRTCSSSSRADYRKRPQATRAAVESGAAGRPRARYGPRTPWSGLESPRRNDILRLLGGGGRWISDKRIPENEVVEAASGGRHREGPGARRSYAGTRPRGGIKTDAKLRPPCPDGVARRTPR